MGDKNNQHQQGGQNQRPWDQQKGGQGGHNQGGQGQKQNQRPDMGGKTTNNPRDNKTQK